MKPGLLLSEHLAALLVTLLAAAWLTAINQYYQIAVRPLQTQASAYYAASVALALAAPGRPYHTMLQVGEDKWQVTIDDKQIKIQGGGQTYQLKAGIYSGGNTDQPDAAR